MQMIVDESNLYARQCMSVEKYDRWEKFTIRDLEAYYGFSILMAINSRPAIHHYWSTDPTYRFSYIADKITRDRYCEITRYLHYVDNLTLDPPGTPGYDRLGKVRPVLDYLHDRFSTVYTPGENLAVDEAMIKFQNRSSLKQYMPKKPRALKCGFWVTVLMVTFPV